MPLIDRNASLVKIKYSYGAHQKNLNEDRTISLVAKCRPMILVATNIRYMRICVGGPSGGSVNNNKCKRLADVQGGTFILGTCRCGLLATQVLAAFIINIRSFSINALNAICLNSFRIKSAQSDWRRGEQNYGGIDGIWQTSVSGT